MDQGDIQKLAYQFAHNAVEVKAGDNVWIEYVGPEASVLADACRDEVVAAGGNPYMIDVGGAAITQFLSTATEDDMKAEGQRRLDLMKTMQGFIRVRDSADLATVKASKETKNLYDQYLKPSLEWRVNHTRWLLVETPTAAFAKASGMDLPRFEEFYRDVCLADYQSMETAVKPLNDLMRATDKVHLTGVGTDLRFSIKDIGAVSCTGKRNIPDGECYSAPVKDSVEGAIKFGPSKYSGESFQSISLRFEKGKIIEAVAETDERTVALNAILDKDAGARYIGEFAIAFNPYVLHPTGLILFDEKIDGSIHFTPGQCYDEASNGNDSIVHWDMVHIQRPDYGGGTIEFDGQIIRKDGVFVHPKLLGLNPENLKAPKP